MSGKRETDRALQFVDDKAPGMEHAVFLMAAFSTARLREELTALAMQHCPDCDKAVDIWCERLVHWVDRPTLAYVICKAPLIRARLRTLESEETQ